MSKEGVSLHAHLEVEMEEDNHLPLGGLEEGVLQVVEQDVHTITLQCCVAQPIYVGLKSALCEAIMIQHQQSCKHTTFVWV